MGAEVRAVMNAREKAVDAIADLFEENGEIAGAGSGLRGRVAFRAMAEEFMREHGLVAVDPALRDAVEAAKRTAVRDAELEGYVPDPTALTNGPYYEATPSDYAVACAALAVDVLGQLEAKP